MTTKYQETYAALMAPIQGEKTRTADRAGSRSYSYVTAAQVQNRLDDVLGPENWDDTYQAVTNGVICTLTLVMHDGAKIPKQGFGGFAGMDDEGDDFKSGESDAFKRAASKHGIGRYLRGDGVPSFAAARFEGYHGPAASNGQSTSSGGGGNGGGSSYAANYGCPSSGKALFAWMKDREHEFGWSVLDGVNSHPQIKNIFPQRMTEWDQSQVAFGYSVMKQIWEKAGKWPAGQGTSPGEVPNGQPANGGYSGGQARATEPGTVAAPDANPEELAAIKKQIRSVYEQVLGREQPGIKVNYVTLMARINAACKQFGFQIGADGQPEMAAYRDMARLKIALMAGQSASGQAPSAAKDADDIPF